MAEKARLNKPTVPSDSTTGKRRVPSTGSQTAQTGVARSTAASSARVRSPIPSSLNPPQASTIAPRSTSGTQLKPRTASVSSIRAKTTLGPSGTSSMGARTNIAGPSKASTLSKLHVPPPCRMSPQTTHRPGSLCGLLGKGLLGCKLNPRLTWSPTIYRYFSQELSRRVAAQLTS